MIAKNSIVRNLKTGGLYIVLGFPVVFQRLVVTQSFSH